MIFSDQFTPPTSGVAYRQGGRLWYILNVPDPRKRQFPPADALKPDGKLDLYPEDKLEFELGAAQDFAPYRPSQPWAPFAPRKGRWLPLGWDWIFDSPYRISPIKDGDDTQWDFHSEDYRLGGFFDDNIERLVGMWGLFSQHIPFLGPYRAPKGPFPDARAADDALQAWKVHLRARLAYISWYVAKTPLMPITRPRVSDPVLNNFLDCFAEHLERAGVAVDLDAVGDRFAGDWALWKRRGIPIAYLWGSAQQSDPELKAFRADYPDNDISIPNAHTRPPRVIVQAARRDTPAGLVMRPKLKRYLDADMHHDDFINDLERINVRVYYEDSPYSPDSAPPSPTDPSLDEDDIEPLSPGYPLRFDEILPFRVTTNASNPDAMRSPPTLMTRLTTPRPETRDDDEEEVGAEDGEPQRSEGEDVALLVDRIDRMTFELGLYAEGKSSADILGDFALGANSSFVNHCAIAVPPTTEVHMLYHLLTNDDVDRSDLWTLALQFGLPFRPLFSAEFAAFYRGRERERARNEVHQRRFEPTWLLQLPEAPIPVLRSRTPQDYCLAYLRTIERVAHYPHIRRLPFYGAIVWRLALEFFGREVLTHAAVAPSDAWVAYDIGAPLEARSPYCSEVYAEPHDDPLVQLLLGQCDLDVSFWPPMHVLTNCYKWTGIWSPNLEDWFVERVKSIRDRTAIPRAVGYWRDDWGRRPSKIRNSTAYVPAAARAAAIVADAHEVHPSAIDLFARPGFVEHDPAHPLE
ncbi:hypothetical protein PsYK624_091550 [Phanerochaete sordida]|uniref:Uncharacterized protein n=1 Tax=Phanerochaete sordida TaxID=48140 RepID=A0A9P3LEY0_9APHY|nr:hypothetical protein PsYK624_091550 [Phanerochaete sordida]